MQARVATVLALLVCVGAGAGSSHMHSGGVEAQVLAGQKAAVAQVRISFASAAPVGTGLQQHNMLLECHRSWAPASFDRFLHLVHVGFLDSQFFVRAIPGYVLDWNYGPTSRTTAHVYDALTWFKPSESDKDLGGKQMSNTVGMVAFGQEADGATKSEVFVNLADNGSRLDALSGGGGFWPFATVVEFDGKRVQGGQADDCHTLGELVEAAVNFQHGDVFFAGGASLDEANKRQQAVIAGGNEHIARTYSDLTQITSATIVRSAEGNGEG